MSYIIKGKYDNIYPFILSSLYEYNFLNQEDYNNIISKIKSDTEQGKIIFEFEANTEISLEGDNAYKTAYYFITKVLGINLFKKTQLKLASYKQFCRDIYNPNNSNNSNDRSSSNDDSQYYDNTSYGIY